MFTTLEELDQLLDRDPEAMRRIVARIVAGLEAQLVDVPDWDDLSPLYLEV